MQKCLAPALAALSLSVIAGLAHAQGVANVEQSRFNPPGADDGSKINQLLANYTQSVSSGDRSCSSPSCWT